ncbi:unnamed protein product [Rhizopus stolonifer]
MTLETDVIKPEDNFEQSDAEKSEVEEGHIENIEEGLLDEVPDDIEEIDLVHMKVSDLPSLGLEKFKKLNRLYLRQNFIFDLKGLNSLSSLTELDFYDNKISHISRPKRFGSFDVMKLGNLDFSFNKIKHIKNIEKLTELENLYFVSNKISKIENLDTFPKLQNIELGANRIRVIENLNHLVSLTQLWLGKNKLLNWSHNAITKIEGLENNLKLTIIDIANNALTKIENLGHLPALQEIWANNNQFGNECYQQVEEELGKIKALHTVYLEGNPMQLENKATYRNKIRLSLPNIQQIDATPVR